MKINYRRITRKVFFKHLAVILSLPFVYLAFKTILRHKSFNRTKEIRLPIDLEKDLMFFTDLIYIKQNNIVQFYSSKCTHLGCKINTFKNNYLACACHGSHFSLEGKVLKGPASSNLKTLDYLVDYETNEYIVKLG